MSDLPEHIKLVARELAAVAKKNGLCEFDATFRCSWKHTDWSQMVTLKWRPGRHEEDADKVEVWSEFREMVSIKM